MSFIADAVGLGTRYEPSNAEFYLTLLKGRVRDLMDDINDPEMASLPMREFFDQLARRSPETLERPMTSLRDVDVPGLLVPAPENTGRGRRSLNNEQLAELMRFLRRGGSGVVGRDGA